MTRIYGRNAQLEHTILLSVKVRLLIEPVFEILVNSFIFYRQSEYNSHDIATNNMNPVECVFTKDELLGRCVGRGVCRAVGLGVGLELTAGVAMLGLKVVTLGPGDGAKLTGDPVA
eukprot:CAMPEP_0196165594 /NCGR_PEP_ID=MMETSP0911-20130528/1411_1 /TAXON_ID=49265 /ORGANISM="Thalassiosira rotula, Strain GSO102" /LENGTH=115 /DNA_ID=CAMNT_0041431047 /DNA_START=346 /DNA_END=693 /DNA_ORIENTATION=+